jgi:hypothetical protein
MFGNAHDWARAVGERPFTFILFYFYNFLQQPTSKLSTNYSVMHNALPNIPIWKTFALYNKVWIYIHSFKYIWKTIALYYTEYSNNGVYKLQKRWEFDGEEDECGWNSEI